MLTLGLSYHMHVFGLAQNVPAVITFSGQYYHFKSHGLIDFYGEPSAAHDIEQSSVMDVLLTVMYCLAERENASTSIAQTNAKLLQRNDWSIELLASRNSVAYLSIMGRPMVIWEMKPCSSLLSGV